MDYAFRGEHPGDFVQVKERLVFDQMCEERDGDHEGEVVVRGGNGRYPEDAVRVVAWTGDVLVDILESGRREMSSVPVDHPLMYVNPQVALGPALEAEQPSSLAPAPAPDIEDTACQLRRIIRRLQERYRRSGRPTSALSSTGGTGNSATNVTLGHDLTALAT